MIRFRVKRALNFLRKNVHQTFHPGHIHQAPDDMLEVPRFKDALKHGEVELIEETPAAPAQDEDEDKGAEGSDGAEGSEEDDEEGSETGSGASEGSETTETDGGDAATQQKAAETQKTAPGRKNKGGKGK